MSSRAPLVLRHGPLTVCLSPLDGAPNLTRAAAAVPQTMPVVWLDSARSHEATGRWSLLGYDPWLTLTARGDRIELRTSASSRTWRGHPLEALREVLRRYRAPASLGFARDAVPSASRGSTSLTTIPSERSESRDRGTARALPHARAIGLLGFLSYDLNRWIERLPAPQASEDPVPDLRWFGMRVIVLVDHLEQRSWLLSVADPHQPPTLARRQALETLEAAAGRLAVEAPLPAGATDGPEPAAEALAATTTQTEFEDMVRRALESIRAGEIFQANVSHRFTTTWRAPILPLYQRLRRINPSPFACYLSCDELAVVSCSPERLVRVQEGRVDTRPIAGTRPRGMSPAEDALNSLDLLLSEKERAEHIMLVDLARNDLGRVCEAGSVAVNDLMTLEAYSHVIHIVSDVAGRLRRGVDAVDVIRAVFPGGTITGCPKVRCMEILRELEPVPRGLYTGSLGVLGFDGSLDLNIAIRTMVIRGGRLAFHVGAGIVADSDPAREYRETLAKAAALVAALGIPVPDSADAIAR